jgi:hypothetical protein
MWYRFTFQLEQMTEPKHEHLLAAFNELYIGAPKPCDAGLFLCRPPMATARVLYLFSGLDAGFDFLVARFNGEASEPPAAADVSQVGGEKSMFSGM